MFGGAMDSPFSPMSRSRHKSSGERALLVAITCLQWERDGSLAEADQEGVLNLLGGNHQWHES
jgi:hypothetical protein